MYLLLLQGSGPLPLLFGDRHAKVRALYGNGARRSSFKRGYLQSLLR